MTRAGGEGPELLHELVRRSAVEDPGNVAVVYEGRRLTYGELDALSDGVACALQSAGVKRGDRVGVYLPKSASSIISVYSILKSGGAYVPFDPDAPAERLAYISKNCGIRTVLTNASKMPGVEAMATRGAPLGEAVLVEYGASAPPTFEPGPGSKLSVVGWESAKAAGVPSPVSASEDDTAYILYTSGSTGVPKGVTLSHRNAMAFVSWGADCVGLGKGDVVACHAPLHFDISTFSIFSTCRAGGAVLMVPDKASTFPADLSALIEREGVTVWYSVPSALVLLTLYGSLAKRNLARLRAIIFAGEVFPVKYLRQLMDAIPQARYLNWYGPTETNVCTSYEVPRGDGELSGVPIGKPCDYADAFALKDDGGIVSGPGESGELFVGGATVMQGYWGDEEKTTKLIVPDPRHPPRTGRVYKTGDLVTLDEEGNYIYLGRRDGMIKTRGYRVELGEVEAALYQHPSVKEAVVVPVPDDLVGNKLHAFVSPQEGAPLTRAEVLNFCAQKLPKYMVPDGVSFMKTLPKTSNGKMDRVGLAKVAAEGRSH